MRTRPLFSGLDCLPGQLDLFRTDGPPDVGPQRAMPAEPSQINAQVKQAKRQIEEVVREAMEDLEASEYIP